jgi:hypothetical protein
MKNDYFGDLVAEFVTGVTAAKPTTVTPEKTAWTQENNDLPQGVTGVTALPRQNNVTEQTKVAGQTWQRQAYRFRLHSGDGGVFITDAQTLEAARAELVTTYGGRLALVARA